MHAIAWRTFCATQRASPRKACRIICGVRHSYPTTRKFHRSSILAQNPEPPPTTGTTGTPIDTQGKDIEKHEEAAGISGMEGEGEGEVKDTDGEQLLPERTRRRRSTTDYGSAVNRSNRNRRSTGVPAVNLPDWFLVKCVKLGQETAPRVAARSRAKPDVVSDGKDDVSKATASSDPAPLPTEDVKVAQETASSIQDMKDEVGEKGLLNGIASYPPDSKDTAQGKEILEETAEPNSSLDGKVEGKETVSLPPDSDDKIKGNETIEEVTLSPSLLEEKAAETVTKIDDPFSDWKLGHYMCKWSDMDPAQVKEILANLNAALRLPAPTNIELKDLHRPGMVFLYPKDGGLSSLDLLVDIAAQELKADRLFLEPDDLAELVGGYLGENIAWTSNKNTVLMGFESQESAGRMESMPSVEYAEIAPEEEEEEVDKPKYRPSKPTSYSSSPLIKKLINSLTSYLSTANLQSSSATATITESPVPGQSSFQYSPQQASALGVRTASSTDPWLDLKVNIVLEAMLDSVSKKRKGSLHSTDLEPNLSEFESSGLIVHISEYNEIVSTAAGAALIAKLEDLIKKRWHGGEKIFLVGTSCSGYQIPEFSKAEVQTIQSHVPNSKNRTLLVTPRPKSPATYFENSERQRIRRANIRHVRDMLTQLGGIWSNEFEVNDVSLNELEEAVFPVHKVHRIATTMLGTTSLQSNSELPENAVNASAFQKALDMISASDKAKFSWAAREKRRLDKEDKDAVAESEKKDIPESAEDRIKQLKENCNFHEKKLLNGVVHPKDLKTTFSDVRAPPETIEALKTLTTLSLIRPEAFTYGVLATDKIPGLLLYGPPGTGKTMLAKAVAKESGATVLDVSGADLFNLYVGEGEKNVRALFSLAKKLTPCVVFIDEADAVFGSRSGDSSKRNSHRELINQFLREWDGMKDMSAFIMVATNRPFDLDDAVLRRLPRRLLVDLPTEKDREAILKLHLANEILDESVSLGKMAKETPFYSGSDLKNVSVAAALACVREENAEAAKHTGAEAYVYPVKRILSTRHFERALEEISASISEDMSTLTAVRKFDEKYGDRKGRRKKRAAIGFGGLLETEKDSEAGRVRKIQVASVGSTKIQDLLC